MSFDLVQDCIDMQAEGVSMAEFAVMVVLCRHADDNGQSCYPSLKTIADKARANIKTARSAIRSLETDGWIVVRRGKSGTMSYEVNAQKISEAAKSVTGTKNGTELGLMGTKNGTHRLPKTVPDGLPETVPEETNRRKTIKNYIPTTTHAPARPVPELTYDRFSMDDSRRWCRKLLGIGQAKAMAVKHFRGPNGVNLESFSTALYCDKAIFNAYLPWLKVLRIRGEI